ncbi:MAG: PD40 domain-containing protein [Chloroflexi bacterium]|nr:PD40 domain-containing protein [Chloroflexota bacterium]
MDPVDVDGDGNGGHPTNLTNSALGEFGPYVSPDGRKIAFSWPVETSNGDVYVMDADGSNRIQLTNVPGNDYSGNWSPDGLQLVFNTVGEVFIMDATDADGDGNGDNQIQLTNHPTGDGGPIWSPDGQKIAWTAHRDGNAELYVMDAVDSDGDGNGDNPTNISNNPANDGPTGWSPDSTRIINSTDRDGNFELYVMDADGGNPVRLTNNPALDGSGTWSPGAGNELSGVQGTDAPVTVGCGIALMNR